MDEVGATSLISIALLKSSSPSALGTLLVDFRGRGGAFLEGESGASTCSSNGGIDGTGGGGEDGSIL